MTGSSRVTPGAPQPSQLFPGKAALTPFSGSGCLFLLHLSSTASLLQLQGRAGHQGPLPRGHGDEGYWAELLFLLWKGKEHYWDQEREQGLHSLEAESSCDCCPTGAGAGPAWHWAPPHVLSSTRKLKNGQHSHCIHLHNLHSTTHLLNILSLLINWWIFNF